MGMKNAVPGKSSNQNPSLLPPPGYHLLNSQAVSGTNTYHSALYNAANLDNIGLQIVFAGTMIGAISVECSIDAVTWIALTFTPPLSNPAGSNLSYLVNLNQLPFPYMRVSYTNASGSGTLDVYLSAKDLN